MPAGLPEQSPTRSKYGTRHRSPFLPRPRLARRVLLPLRAQAQTRRQNLHPVLLLSLIGVLFLPLHGTPLFFNTPPALPCAPQNERSAGNSDAPPQALLEQRHQFVAQHGSSPFQPRRRRDRGVCCPCAPSNSALWSMTGAAARSAAALSTTPSWRADTARRQA
jgi:hypothetical protein